MYAIFIELYERLAKEIDDNRFNTHNFKDEYSDRLWLDKKECKKEIAKVLNSRPDFLEPLFSRLAKCAAIPSMDYNACVLDPITDRNFTDIGECYNGNESWLSFLVEFYDGLEPLDESVYIRIIGGTFYIYDLKPYNTGYYNENSAEIEIEE